jgi:transcriptional regulator with XRE-family HTH domain
VTLNGWQERVTRTVAREVRRHRGLCKMSAQQLADRTAELGMPIPRAVLANLESGRRDVVTVAEVLVLAAALGVTPAELFCPVGFDEEIELLPGRAADPLSGSQWVSGQLALDLSGPELGFQLPPAGEESNARLAEQHADLLEQVRVRESEVSQQMINVDAVMTGVRELETIAESVAGQEHAALLMSRAAEHRKLGDRLTSELVSRVSATARYQVVAAQSLRYIRAEMRHRGMHLPPLPPSMKGTDG